MDIIRNNCDFDFHFNNTEITPMVMDGGDEIILANWPNDKHLICNINPYHAKGYTWLVSTSTKCNYSHDQSKCSSMPSGTIVLHWVFGSKIDSRRCHPLFIILYIFLRWGNSFLVYIVPVLCHTAKKMKTMKLS